MKQKISPKLILWFSTFCLIPFCYGMAQVSEPSKSNVVSYVDTSLEGSQKYVLMVDGKPFYMTNIQIRLDNMRYSPGWNPEATEAVIIRAANDGFNTVSIPVHWREVEPEKDKFDWNILDEYLGLVNKYDIKMELLWFGTNSGGIVQRLGRSNNLRTPDYILYSPATSTTGGYDSYSQAGGKTETKSEFRIRRNVSDYSLDLADNNLRARETYVLGKVMEHVAKWDVANGSRHPLIGVQIGNEVVGYSNNPFPNSLVISYLSDVAGAVKNSEYVVWTRVNCVFWKIPARIHENELLRSTQGTNLDFIGIDTYRHHFKTDADFLASMRTNLPYTGKNFRMIMETNSSIPISAQMHLAALSGNNAIDYYDFSGIYNVRPGNITTTAGHIEDIRLVNKILSGDIVDIALNAHGYGLYVHNWEGTNSTATTSNAGITFRPAYPTSQGISIIRSNFEIVLMSTKGGTFIIPDSLKVKSAAKGSFDKNNRWVNKEDISLRGNNSLAQGQGPGPGNLRPVIINIEAGTIILLTKEDSGEPKAKSYQAEFAQLGGGLITEADIHSIGFSGNGYAKLPSGAGVYINWRNVDGLTGGEKTIRIRYSHGGSKPTKAILDINGNEQYIFLKPTGSWDLYQYFTITAPLNSGANNIIRIETADNTIRKDRVVYYEGGGNIDELQVF